MRRAIRSVAPMLALGLALTACGRGGDEETESGGGSGSCMDDTITIGWTPPDVTGVFQTATNFFEDAAEEANQAGYDVKVETRAPAEHTGFADQVAIIEDFVTQNVDVIVVSPADTEAIKPAIQKANEAEIPVVMVNLLEEQEGIELASYIGFDNSEAAQVSGYAVLDYFGGPGVLGEGEMVDPPEDGYLDLDWWTSVYDGVDTAGIEAKGAVIEGIAGTFFSDARNEGFHAAIDTAPGLEILGEPIAADWNREKGTSAAADFLTRYGDQLDFIWASSNEMGLGAVAAVSQQGKLNTSGGLTPAPEDKISVFTNDVTPESVDAIREGKIIAETHHGFAEWGWLGAETAVRLACGAEVEQFQDIRPRTVYQDNVDDFYPDISLPEIDWEGIAEDAQS